MANRKSLLDSFMKNNITFFTGVPDSLLSDFSKELEEKNDEIKHIIAPNEGNALSIATGSFIANKQINVVYLQNSGLGNIINPFLSLAHKEVWSIPLFFVIGWRGRPNEKDEPQHMAQGKITINLLKNLKIKYEVVKDNQNYYDIIKNLKDYALDHKAPVAIVFSNKYNSPYKNTSNSLTKNKNIISRIRAIEELLKHTKKNDIIISTTGKTSRELYLLRKRKNIIANDLYVIGGMGHASSIALGIMENIYNRRIFLLDGDGAMLMHMGILSLLGTQKKNILFHILLNNKCHDSVGGQPTSIQNIDLRTLSKAFKYKNYVELRNLKSINTFFNQKKMKRCSSFINIKIAKGSEPKLPRPKELPKLNLIAFEKVITNKDII